MRSRATWLLLALFVLAFTARADEHSSDILRQKQELEKIQKDVAAGQKRLDSLEAEQTRVQKAISKYDDKMTSDRKVVKRLTSDLKKIQADIARGDSLLSQAREMFDRSQRRYLGNIRQFYSLASRPTLALGGSPNDELDHQRRLIYLTALADFESGTVRNASALVTLSADALNGMSDRQKQISGLKKDRETSYALGESQRQRQAKNLDQLRRKSMTEADRVISLRQAAEEMQNIVARLEEARTRRNAQQPETGPSAFAGLQGQLLAPYKGKITQAFGEHVDPVSRLKSFSPGVTIKGKAKGDVLSVASGTVAYSGNLRGYGNFVIINHDHQYYTTYAGLGEVLVSEGQYVSSRTRVGTADSEGTVRFELRNGREPLDPVKWIRIESL
jgi:septal ring factor EnvC (AmiA/AmiB activator)